MLPVSAYLMTNDEPKERFVNLKHSHKVMPTHYGFESGKALRLPDSAANTEFRTVLQNDDCGFLDKL